MCISEIGDDEVRDFRTRIEGRAGTGGVVVVRKESLFGKFLKIFDPTSVNASMSKGGLFSVNLGLANLTLALFSKIKKRKDSSKRIKLHVYPDYTYPKYKGGRDARITADGRETFTVTLPIYTVPDEGHGGVMNSLEWDRMFNAIVDAVRESSRVASAPGM